MAGELGSGSMRCSPGAGSMSPTTVIFRRSERRIRIRWLCASPDASVLSSVVPSLVVTRTRGAPSAPRSSIARLGSPRRVRMTRPAAWAARATLSSRNFDHLQPSSGHRKHLERGEAHAAADLERADLDAGAGADRGDVADRAPAEVVQQRDVGDAGADAAVEVEALVVRG